VVVVALFALSWWFRYSAPANEPSTLAFILALAEVGIGAVTGWLGGELVDRIGVGVDPGAHVNASSSLSGMPAATDLRHEERPVEPLREREVGR
jgi:hypothetical protein